MRLFFIGSFVCLLAMFASLPVFAQAKTAADLIVHVEKANQSIRTYSASFTQTYNDLAAGSSKTATGSVYLKKPGKIRWIYMDPKNPKARDKEYVSDGLTFWTYEHALQQVYATCIKDNELMPHLKLLMGQGEFLKRFNVSFSKKSSKAAPQLKLVPKKNTPLYKEVRFTLNPESFQIVKTDIFDPYGNSTTYVFSKVKTNKKLADKGFVLKAPKSVRRLGRKQKCS